MRKFKIRIRKQIIAGWLEETHIVEAEDEQIADHIVENDECSYCVNIDYSIEQSEKTSFEMEEL